MNTSLDPARREELVDTIAAHLRAWNLNVPAIICLRLYEPLAFLGSHLLLVAQPLVGLLTGDRLARDLALLSEEPENIEHLILELEK